MKKYKEYENVRHIKFRNYKTRDIQNNSEVAANEDLMHVLLLIISNLLLSSIRKLSNIILIFRIKQIPNKNKYIILYLKTLATFFITIKFKLIIHVTLFFSIKNIFIQLKVENQPLISCWIRGKINFLHIDYEIKGMNFSIF